MSATKRKPLGKQIDKETDPSSIKRARELAEKFKDIKATRYELKR
jgi:hypothetical protein